MMKGASGSGFGAYYPPPPHHAGGRSSSVSSGPHLHLPAVTPPSHSFVSGGTPSAINMTSVLGGGGHTRGGAIPPATDAISQCLNTCINVCAARRPTPTSGGNGGSGGGSPSSFASSLLAARRSRLPVVIFTIIFIVVILAVDRSFSASSASSAAAAGGEGAGKHHHSPASDDSNLLAGVNRNPRRDEAAAAARRPIGRALENLGVVGAGETNELERREGALADEKAEAEAAQRREAQRRREEMSGARRSQRGGRRGGSGGRQLPPAEEASAVSKLSEVEQTLVLPTLPNIAQGSSAKSQQQQRIGKPNSKSNSLLGVDLLARRGDPDLVYHNPPPQQQQQNQQGAAKEKEGKGGDDGGGIVGLSPSLEMELNVGAGFDQRQDARYADTTHLILVPGHAVFKGTDYGAWADPSQWAFEAWQRSLGGGTVAEAMVHTYAHHVRRGLAAMLSSFDETRAEEAEKRRLKKEAEDTASNKKDAISTVSKNGEKLLGGDEAVMAGDGDGAPAAEEGAAVLKADDNDNTDDAMSPSSNDEAKKKKNSKDKKSVEEAAAEAARLLTLKKRQHIKESIVLFSGGQSRSDSGPRSEGLSYYMLASAMNFFNLFGDAPQSQPQQQQQQQQQGGDSGAALAALPIPTAALGPLDIAESPVAAMVRELSTALMSEQQQQQQKQIGGNDHKKSPSVDHAAAAAVAVPQSAADAERREKALRLLSELRQRLAAEQLEPHLSADPPSGRTLAEQHIFVEEFARDSYENLLFAVARFYEITGKYPKKITIVGFEYKRERFERVHRRAIRFPKADFHYVGIDYVEAAAAAGVAVPPLVSDEVMAALAAGPPTVAEASTAAATATTIINAQVALAPPPPPLVGGATSNATEHSSLALALALPPASASAQEWRSAHNAAVAAKFLRSPSDAATLAYVEKDTYLCAANLNTRRKRNPQHRVEPYQRSAPHMAPLLRHCGPALFEGQLPWSYGSDD